MMTHPILEIGWKSPRKTSNAYIGHYGRMTATLRRIHMLDVLLTEAIPYEPSLARYQLVCQKITAFYMLDRYPTLADAGTTEQIVRDCHRDVQGLIRQIRAALQPIFP
jgi:hypothetical protein